jgi:hypothetical protein
VAYFPEGERGEDEGEFSMGLGVTIEKKRGTSPEVGGPQACDPKYLGRIR